MSRFPFRARKCQRPLLAVQIFVSVSSLLVALFFRSVQASPPQRLPFTLGVRDSFMVAHSFHNHPAFGPAGGMHGATYTCDVEFSSERLNKDTNWVLDIGLASNMLQEVIAKYNLQNLDEVFPDKQLTTTEFLARQIHEDLCCCLKEQCKEFKGDLCVKLWESHKAWASYYGKVA